MHSARLRLGQLLVDARILTSEQLEEVLTLQRTDGRKLGALLVESGLVTETLLTQVLSQQLSVPWVSLNHIDFSTELLALVPLDLAEKYCVVPIYVRAVRGQGDTLYVAMEDPMNEDALNECTARSGLPARAMIAAPSEIFRVLRMFYGSTMGGVSPASAVAGTAPLPSAKVAVGAPPPARAAPPPRPVANAGAASGDAAHRSNIGDARATDVTPSATAAVEASGSMGAEARANADDDAPLLEVAEVDLTQRRKRGRQLTLLDGTTIKLPADKKRASGRRRSEPAPSGDLTAADVLAALRAAAHGVDSTDVLGETLRWEKMMAAVLTLLLRKHLLLERELLDELKKI
jgi:type IV pilus assembly protein PilB